MKYEKGAFATVPIKLVEGRDPQTQVVFMHICKHVNETGQCWPSIKSLAASCGMDKRTVQRRINDLVEAGILVKTSRYRDNGSSTSNAYDVVLASGGGVTQPGGGVSACHGGGVSVPPPELNTIELKPDLTKNTNTRGEDAIASTPSEQAKVFFEKDDHKELIAYFSLKGVPEEQSKRELGKFILYWTEPTRNGKKQRWETEKTFEVRRRLVTWFSRIGGYQKNQETKGIVI